MTKLDVWICCDEMGCKARVYGGSQISDRVNEVKAFIHAIKQDKNWEREVVDQETGEILHYCPDHNPNREAQP